MKTLYEIPQPGEDDDAGEGTPPSGKTGECSMEGYMDKLPMGRRRASLIKKWKRRYFRCKKGNIFYYEVKPRELLFNLFIKCKMYQFGNEKLTAMKSFTSWLSSYDWLKM